MAAETAIRIDVVPGSEARAYRAMNATAHAVVVAERPTPLLDHVGRRLAELEARWSRFRPDSEITGLNTAGGDARRASDDTVRLVEALVGAWHATGGAFDPTLLGALVELGYASSRSDATMRTSLGPDARLVGRPDLVLVDREHGVVQLPQGTTIDPGGLGKGLAADLIVQELLDLGAMGALVEIGGDLRVAGDAPTGDGWTISVHARGEGGGSQVALRAGGVATSSSRLRTWLVDGEHRHHLIDPRQLRPTADDVIGCTIIAGSAAWAEAFTKVAFVLGRRDASEVYERYGLAARIVTEDGATHETDAWSLFSR